jgi:metallo-beta-lactamase class B
MRILESFSIAVLLFTINAAAMEIPASWTRAVEPVRVAGNLHYVGTADLGSYLLIGSEGAILLDAPLEENAELILQNLEKIGVKPADVRILLNSHAHFDHIGGMAALKAATGAKLYLSAADAELAARGGRGDFAFGDSVPYTPLTTDAIVADGDVVRLGNIAMTALLTPGHTRGCTSWRTTVIEEGEPLDVVFLCSVTAPGYTLAGNEKYPEILDDYRRSFDKLRQLDPDIFLANHGSFFGLTKKLAEKKEDGRNPFVGRGELAAHLDRAWKDLEARAAKQRADND